MSRMFEFITKTWNPLGGECMYQCSYCWARALCKKHNMKKYIGPPYIVDNELRKTFDSKEFVFVQDMTDLLADNVEDTFIRCILSYVDNSKAKFLFLTKNPARYLILKEFFPEGIILGATIESNKDYPHLSKAPSQSSRLHWMNELSKVCKNQLFISIEPILDFDLEALIAIIKSIRPWGVAVGYDNWDNKLTEPPLSKTLDLIEELKIITNVFIKTLREGCNP